jgi:phage-related protein (TIGR01555 family)
MMTSFARLLLRVQNSNTDQANGGDMSDENIDEQIQALKARNDGLANTLSKLGTAKDNTSRVNNVVEMAQPLSQVECEILFTEHHYPARVVELLPNESTRRGFDIILESEDVQKEINQQIHKKLKLIGKLRKADILGRVYGGAAVILGINDGQTYDKPVNLDAIKSIDWAIVVDRYSLTEGDLEADPRAPWGFGLPNSYRVNHPNAQPEAGADSGDQLNAGKINGMTIHASRMIRFYGVELPDRVRSRESYWGASVFQRLYDSLVNLEMSEKAFGNIIQKFNRAVFRKKGLGNFVAKAGGKDELLELFTLMSMSESILGMTIVDEGETFERITQNVSGIEGLFDRIAQSFGAAADAPLTKVFGLSPAGLNSDDESGKDNWRSTVRSNQTTHYVPAIEYVVQMLLVALGEVDEDFEVEPRALHEVSEKEKAETFNAWADAVTKLIDRGVLSPIDARKSFSKAGWSTSIHIDDDEDTFEQPPEQDPNALEPNEAPKEDGLIPPAKVRAVTMRGLRVQAQFKVDSKAITVADSQIIASRQPLAIQVLKRMAAPQKTVTQRLLYGGENGRRWAADALERLSLDANTDPPAKRSARRKVQTEIDAGRMKPAKERKCVVCKKAQASEYDHVEGYDGDEVKLSVEAVCASCHHLRTNKRIKDQK